MRDEAKRDVSCCAGFTTGSDCADTRLEHRQKMKSSQIAFVFITPSKHTSGLDHKDTFERACVTRRFTSSDWVRSAYERGLLAGKDCTIANHLSLPKWVMTATRRAALRGLGARS